MTTKTKKTITIIAIIVVVCLIGVFIANYLANRKFEKFVAQLPEHIQLQYDDANISVLGGNLRLQNPLVTLRGKTTKNVNAKIKLDALDIKDLGYWDFLVNDKLSLDKIELKNPKITYFHNDLVEDESYSPSLDSQLKQAIKVKHLNILNASVAIFDQATDSLIFKTEHLELKVEVIALNSETMKSKLPIDFENMSFKTENLKFQMNEFDDLYVDSLSITKAHSKFSGLKIKTKYSKAELSQKITIERDHFNVDIASVEVFDQDAGFHGDSIFDFRSKRVIFTTPQLKIYRDKLVADDPVKKDLYSKMLRTLNFNLSLDEVSLKDGLIVYEEKVKEDKGSGELQFKQLNATITNVGNTYDELTSLDINANFMKNTPIKVNWDFDVHDVNDHFTFKAELGVLKAEDLNPFMTPNLNITLEGELNTTYFTVDANANTGNIDLKTKYDEFDVNVLKSDGKEKNKLISGLVNLFVAKTSKKNEDGFRYGHSENVERNKTKSVFNYVWINVKSGLLSAMTGGGKKK